MARITRVEIFRPDEIAIVHVMNRTVRRCFLLGKDPFTGKNCDHRRAWNPGWVAGISSGVRELSAAWGRGSYRWRSPF